LRSFCPEKLRDSGCQVGWCATESKTADKLAATKGRQRKRGALSAPLFETAVTKN
jgi:hypothetical protein